MLLFIPAWAEEGGPTSAPAETEIPAETEAPAETPVPSDVPAPTAAPGPAVRLTRDFSSRYAEYGEKITLSYTVRNDGLVPIEHIQIRDGLVGDVGYIERLEPGEKKTMSVRYRVTETCTSTPGISYVCGELTYREGCESGRISLADVALRVELDADKTNVAPGETVTLRLRLVNEGNVNLYGLRAEEPMLGEMGSLVNSLPPGDECAVTRTVQMKSTGTFQFSVSGSSDTGGAVSVQSNEMSVIVTPVAAQIQLNLKAEADRRELTGPGQVTFSLYVDNECSLELRNVLLSEETRGKIRELVFVPTGEMPAITAVYDVEESGSYRFMAQVTDSVGDRLTVYSEPIGITVTGGARATEAPEQTEPTDDPKSGTIPVLDGVPYRMKENPATFEKLMIGAAAVLMAVLILWYIVTGVRNRIARLRRAIRRRKQKKNRRAAGKSEGN